MNTLTLKIEGMQCDGCADRIRTLLEKEVGIRKAEVSYPDARASIILNEHSISQPRVREVIERAGFSVLEG